MCGQPLPCLLPDNGKGLVWFLEVVVCCSTVKRWAKDRIIVPLRMLLVEKGVAVQSGSLA